MAIAFLPAGFTFAAHHKPKKLQMLPPELDLSTVYTDLKHGAALANTNLSQICEAAGVHRATVEQWKEKPPRVFGILTKLAAALKAANELNTTSTSAAE